MVKNQKFENQLSRQLKFDTPDNHSPNWNILKLYSLNRSVNSLSIKIWIFMHPLTSYICSPFPSYICAPLFLPKFVPLFLPKFVPLFLPKFVPLCIPNCVPLFLPRFVPLFLPRFVPLFLSFMRLCLHFHSMHLLNQTF